MAARVNPVPPKPVITNVQDGARVQASDLIDMAGLMNHVFGMGAQAVPLYCPGQTITAGNTATLRFRNVPRYQTIQRMWAVGCRSAHATAASGVELAAPTGGALTTHPGRAVIGRGGMTPILYVENLAAQTGFTESDLTIDIKATDRDIVVEALGCIEMPRRELAIAENGQDLELLRSGSPIMSGVDGRYVGGMTCLASTGRLMPRRNGLIQWSVDGTAASAKGFTSGSFTDLWLVPVPILGRKFYRTSTLATVSTRIYAWIDRGAWGGAIGADIQWNTTSGGTAVAALSLPDAAGSETPQWWPSTAGAAKTFSVDCEDLTAADGRRSTRWDDVQVQVKNTGGGGTVCVASVSVWEDVYASLAAGF